MNQDGKSALKKCAEGPSVAKSQLQMGETKGTKLTQRSSDTPIAFTEASVALVLVDDLENHCQRQVVIIPTTTSQNAFHSYLTNDFTTNGQ